MGCCWKGGFSPSRAVDIESQYPGTETRYLFTPDKEEEIIQQTNKTTFPQFTYKASAISRVNYFVPKNSIIQHLPIEEVVISDGKRYEDVNRLPKKDVTQVLTNVDLDETAKLGGKIRNIFEEVIYRENFKNSPSRKVIDFLFYLKLEYEEEVNGLMVELIKLTMICLCGQSIRKAIDEEHFIRSENWLLKNNDELVVDYEPIPTCEYVIR